MRGTVDIEEALGVVIDVSLSVGNSREGELPVEGLPYALATVEGDLSFQRLVLGLTWMVYSDLAVLESRGALFFPLANLIHSFNLLGLFKTGRFVRRVVEGGMLVELLEF